MTLESQLAALESSGLVGLAATHPEIQYVFRHALIQDAAYRSLLRQDRRRLHMIIGEALEGTHADRLAEVAATLAHHFEKAGVADKSIHYFTLAADRAKAAFANREAIAFYRSAIRQVVDVLRADAMHPEPRNQTASRLHESLGDVLELTGLHDDARLAYEQALTRVTDRSSIWRSHLHRKAAGTLVVERRYEEATQAFGAAEQALGQEPADGAFEWWQELAQIRLDRMWMHYWQAQVREIGELANQTGPIVVQYGTAGQRANFFMCLVLMALRRDRYTVSEETLGHAGTALAASLESASLGATGMPLFSVGFCHLLRGELDEADEHLQRSLNVGERTGDVVLQARCLTYLTLTSRKRGQVEDVRRYISRCVEVSSAGRMLEYIAAAKASLAWVAWHEGNLSEVEVNGRAALDIWQKVGMAVPFRWMALWPLIGAAGARHRISEATEYARGLLAPTEQRLPDALVAAVEQTIASADKGEWETSRIALQHAIQLAQRTGYL